MWGRRDGHDILQCDHCEMLFFERPIEHSFDYQQYYPYLSSFDEARFKWELDVRRRKYKAQLAAVRRLSPTATTLLDLGAGPGYFCRIAAEEGWRVFAVEPSEAARVAGRAQFQIEYVDLDRLPAASVDVILCQHVLEHIEQPQSFIRSLRNKLRVGGLVVFHVPNQEPLSFYLRNIWTGGRCRSHSAMYYPVHVNGFNSRSLRRTVERQEFKSIAIFNASMWSDYYDPFFLLNYYRPNKSFIAGSMAALKHAARCAIDCFGNAFDRGDWIIGYFRAVESSDTQK